MKNLSIVVLCVVVGACVATQEMPLAPNVVRLDTRAEGSLFVGSAGNVTMKKAAEATLARGYTHFVLVDAQTGQGSRFVGMSTSGQGQVSVIGGTAYATGASYSVPQYAPTASVGVTVVMFQANEPEARGAFDASEIVKQFGG